MKRVGEISVARGKIFHSLFSVKTASHCFTNISFKTNRGKCSTSMEPHTKEYTRAIHGVSQLRMPALHILFVFGDNA